MEITMSLPVHISWCNTLQNIQHCVSHYYNIQVLKYIKISNNSRMSILINVHMLWCDTQRIIQSKLSKQYVIGLELSSPFHDLMRKNIPSYGMILLFSPLWVFVTLQSYILWRINFFATLFYSSKTTKGWTIS